jgi:PelA/Pel-15E family pectate lyase
MRRNRGRHTSRKNVLNRAAASLLHHPKAELRTIVSVASLGQAFFVLLRVNILLLAAIALVSTRHLGECAEAGNIQSRWNDSLLRRDQSWYRSAEARGIAENALLYQTALGAWPKNTDLAAKPASAEALEALKTGPSANTIDNSATTTPMRYMALMAQATGETKYKNAFNRGLDYLLSAQYTNGGWPQFYPLRRGYYSHITFNDNAMINTMTLLRDVASGKPPYDFATQQNRGKSAAAVLNGISCILRTQVKREGKRTVWCAQHDEQTLAPAPARNFEPISLSGSESVGITRFLMDIDSPSPAIIAAVEGAVAWFKSTAIPGLRYESFRDAQGERDRRVIADAAAEPLWARFYEIESNRPIFAGRDKKIHYVFAEIEQERRAGYAYYGTWPATLLSKDYPRWRAKHKPPQAP